MRISSFLVCRGCKAFYVVGGGLVQPLFIKHTFLSTPALLNLLHAIVLSHVSALGQCATCRVSDTQQETHQPMIERGCNSHLLFHGRAIIETYLGFYFQVVPYHYTFRALLNTGALQPLHGCR